MFSTLKGTSAGNGLVNALAPRFAEPKAPLKTSIRFCAPLAAYRSGPEALLPIARPVYAAPGVVTLIWAVVPALLFQAEIVPLRLAKMKLAGVPLTGNDEVLLLTWPVGPWGPLAVVGMLTSRAF